MRTIASINVAIAVCCAIMLQCANAATPPADSSLERAVDEADRESTVTNASPFPVFREGEYFDTALYELEYLLIQVHPNSEPGFAATVVAFLYTRNYLGLRRFAETLNLLQEEYPEGITPALVLYRTWRLTNPTLGDMQFFMGNLKKWGTMEVADPPLKRLVAWLEEYIEKNEDYGRSLDKAADAWLAANGVVFAEKLEPAEPKLYDSQVAGDFEAVAQRLRPGVEAGATAPIYHISVPSPLELIPLTQAFDAMESHYGFTRAQMAAAAFTLYCFLEEDVPGRVIGRNDIYKTYFQLGMNATGGHSTGGLGAYATYANLYYTDLSRRLQSCLYGLYGQKALAADITSRLLYAQEFNCLKRTRELAKMYVESLERGDPADEEKKEVLIWWRMSLRFAIQEYEDPEEWRRHSDIFR